MTGDGRRNPFDAAASLTATSLHAEVKASSDAVKKTLPDIEG